MRHSFLFIFWFWRPVSSGHRPVFFGVGRSEPQASLKRQLAGVRCCTKKSLITSRIEVDYIGILRTPPNGWRGRAGLVGCCIEVFAFEAWIK